MPTMQHSILEQLNTEEHNARPFLLLSNLAVLGERLSWALTFGEDMTRKEKNGALAQLRSDILMRTVNLDE